MIIINLQTKAIISRYNARLLASRPLGHIYCALSTKFLNTTKINLFFQRIKLHITKVRTINVLNLINLYFVYKVLHETFL